MIRGEQTSLFLPGELRGLLDYPHCPRCHKSLPGFDSQCLDCGQLISWERWKEYLISEGDWVEETKEDDSEKAAGKKKDKLDYIPDGQMNIFDFLEVENGKF